MCARYLVNPYAPLINSGVLLEVRAMVIAMCAVQLERLRFCE